MIRSFHKYLSLIISVQLLLWTISGIYFAFNKIELVRGEQYIIEDNPSALDIESLNISSNTKGIEVFKRLNQWIVKVEMNAGFKYQDLLGNEVYELSPNQAIEVVKLKTTLSPIDVIKINESSARSEFRGRSLPIYKIKTNSSDDSNVYVDVMSGKIVAIRSDSWRVWDFLWGAHIIDYRERDNINNILLKIFSILALLSSLSGIALFFNTIKKFR
jgi:hypothetical protein|tara:strand:+ start:2451 stop:3098 length:648 start_codon:yes stop_codon:yes gene_type:complete